MLRDIFPVEKHPDLVIGLGEPDDACVYRLDGDTAIIVTADFFPPVVSDPRAFGRIAAANALSDVYAMGGRPVFALNLAAYPADAAEDVITAVHLGAAEKVDEAGAAIAGGHTIDDSTWKFGLMVVGLAETRKVIRKGGLVPGDKLLLTKPLGTGVIIAADNAGMARKRHFESAVASMERLNRRAAEVAVKVGAHAATDVTGFGLVGHLVEMLLAGGCSCLLEWDALPWLAGALDYAAEWTFPSGAGRNANYYAPRVWLGDSLPSFALELLCCPETSGGLLLGVPHERCEMFVRALSGNGEMCRVIGEVTPRAEGEDKVLIRVIRTNARPA